MIWDGETVCRRRFLASTCCGLAAGIPIIARARAGDESVISYGKPQRYRIEHAGRFTNPGVDLLSLEFWLPLPIDSGNQRVTNVSVEPRAAIVADQTQTGKIVKRLLLRDLPGTDESTGLSVSYELTSRPIHADRDRMRVGMLEDYRKTNEFKLFTRSEKKLPLRDDGLAARAKKFRTSGRPAAEIARDIYDWVLDHTEYRLIDGFGGAKYCLEKQHGECGEYAALFVALCRIIGIPARPVVGFWADESNAWHVWAEFQLPSGEWIPVDPSIGDQTRGRREYFFGSLDGRRVALNRTFDIQLARRSRGNRRLDFLQIGAWWYTANRTIEKPEIVFEATGRKL